MQGILFTPQWGTRSPAHVLLNDTNIAHTGMCYCLIRCNIRTRSVEVCGGGRHCEGQRPFGWQRLSEPCTTRPAAPTRLSSSSLSSSLESESIELSVRVMRRGRTQAWPRQMVCKEGILEHAQAYARLRSVI